MTGIAALLAKNASGGNPKYQVSCDHHDIAPCCISYAGILLNATIGELY
jgi:hypothetical protein